MNRKLPAFLLSLTVILSSILPAAPALSAEVESAPARLGLSLPPVSGATSLSVPAVDLSIGQTLSAPELGAAATLGSAASQAISAAQAATKIPAPALTVAPRAPAIAQQAGPATLLSRLTAAVAGKISWTKAFDGAGAYGIRPLPKPVLPQGGAIEIGDAPALPPTGHGQQVTLNNFDIPGTRAMGGGGVFDAGPRVLDASLEGGDAAVEASVKQALLKLIDADVARYGVASSELETVHVKYVEGAGSQADTIYAYFRQQKKSRNVDGTVQNVRVNDSYLSFTVKVVKGKPVLMAAMARLYPGISVATDATMSDEAIKAKASQQLPQDAGLELVFVERKIVFHDGRWRTVNLYDIQGAPIAIGVNVAVDVNDGEVFAWDGRVGVINQEPYIPKPHNKAPEPPATKAGRFILRYRGIRPLSKEELDSAKETLQKAGLNVVDSSSWMFLVDGDAAKVAQAAKDLSAWTAYAYDPNSTHHTLSGRNISGTVTGRAEENDHRPGNVITAKEQGLPHISVSIGGNSQNADADGHYSASAGPADGPAEGKATLDGQWTRVIDQAGQPLSVSATLKPGEQTPMLFNPEGAEERNVDQVNTYLWVTKIHDWWSARLKGDKRIDRQVPANVNIDDECNAYYTPGTPSLNFFKSSTKCSDTGRPGVVAHEYGHFVDDSIGGITNGGMSEGWGDIGSMYLFKTPIIGEGFLKNQDPSWIRNGENNYQYNETDEVHDQGQAWMGFAWKLRKSLIAALGEAAGTAEAEALIIPTLFAKATDIPSQMAQVLLSAMDKDGKVRYEREIRAAARAHGIDLPRNPGLIARLWNGLTSTLSGIDVEIVGPKPRVYGSLLSVGFHQLVPESSSAGIAGPLTSTVLRVSAGRLSRDQVREFIQDAYRYRSSEYANLKMAPVREDRGVFGSEFVIELSGSRKSIEYFRGQLERLSAEAVTVPEKASELKPPTGPMRLTAEDRPQPQPPRLEDLIASLKVIGIEASGTEIRGHMYVTLSTPEAMKQAVTYVISHPEWKALYMAGKISIFFKPAAEPA